MFALVFYNKQLFALFFNLTYWLLTNVAVSYFLHKNGNLLDRLNYLNKMVRLQFNWTVESDEVRLMSDFRSFCFSIYEHGNTGKYHNPWYFQFMKMKIRGNIITQTQIITMLPVVWESVLCKRRINCFLLKASLNK